MKIITIKRTATLLSLCIASALHAAPDTEGRWSSQVSWPLVPIHTVLNAEGDILTWGIDGVSTGQFKYDVWDVDAGTGSNAHTSITSDVNVSSFCSSGLMLPESANILMPGGDARPEGATNSGVNASPIFNTSSNTLSRASDMTYARWYPTSITLPSGEVLVTGGRDGQFREIVTPEIYSPATNQWRSLLGVQTSGYGYFYPKIWVIPDGRVFGMQKEKMYYINANGNGSLFRTANLPQTSRGYSSTAVMYRPGKIMQVSGGNSRDNNGNVLANGTVLVDVTGSAPVVRETSRPAQKGRIWSNSVVLPNGRVMLVGGSEVTNTMQGASYRPEIWDPATEQWSLMAQAQRVRLYHSVATLLKDGRVLVAGGGHPGPETNENAEFFSPPYLFDSNGIAPRPTISAAPDEAPYGAQVIVKHPSSATVSRVTLIKTGAVTHSFNMEQRFIELDFADVSDGVRVKIPDSANIATPGHYMMFLINNRGVPSKGHILRISSTAVLNDSPPVAKPDVVNVTSSDPVIITPLSNDTGTDLVLQNPNAWSLRGGSVSLINGNSLRYTPKAGFNGEDKIWYTINDAQGRSSWSEITINVSGNNGSTGVPPAANPDTVNVTSSAAVTFSPMANDDGTDLVLQAPNAWSLNGGNVVLENGGSLRYTPKPGFNGEDKIWYTINDSQGRSSWGEITLNVSGNNGSVGIPPLGVADAVTTSGPITIDVLANDAGSGLVLGQPNAWSLQGGNVSLVSNKIRYTPKADFNGQDKLWYNFTDSQGRGSWSEVTITVSGNGGTTAPYPVAVAETISTALNTAVVIDVLANDTGAGLSISGVNDYSVQGGSVTIENNKLRYAPKSGYTGSDSFWYSIIDSQNRSNAIAVTVNVGN